MYPALAVVQTLKPNTEILWVGSRGGMEKSLLARAEIPFRGIDAAGLRGKNPLAMAKGVFTLLKGYRQSRKLLREFQPDVLFVTGGYVCVPMTLAAHRAGVPVVIYLPDIQPGQAIKFLSRYADRVAVTAPDARQYFPDGLTVVTGYPVRPELYTADRDTARQRFNLDPALPTVLVFGGSQGARSINRAIANRDALNQLLSHAQLIHISGNRDAEWTQAMWNDLPSAQQQLYRLYPYLHSEMADVFAAADVIISRAGASILGEAPAVGVPSILVPYPYSGAHQWQNARYMEKQGAAITVPDEKLPTDLLPTTIALLTDGDRRAAMAKAAKKLARPDAARAIARLLEEFYDE